MKKLIALLLTLVALLPLVACADANPNGYAAVTAEEWENALALESFNNIKIVSRSYNVRDGVVKPLPISLTYEIANGRIRATRVGESVGDEVFDYVDAQYGYEFNLLIHESPIRIGADAFDLFTYDARTGLYTCDAYCEREYLTDGEGNIVTDEYENPITVFILDTNPPAGREKERYIYGFKDGKLAYLRYSDVPDDEKNMQYSDFCFSDHGTVSITVE